MDGLKQRIIGALVLISLAVIFVPMLFDEPHTDRKTQVIDLPEEPEFPEVTVDSPEMGQSEPVESSPTYRLEEQPMDGADESAAINSSTADQSPQSATTALPDTPPVEDVPPVTEPVPEEPAQSPSSVAPETASAGGEGDDASETAPQVESEEFTESLKGAWLVQLGSFGNEGNARRLRDNVREAGYAAHTQVITRGDKTLTRVFSGPYAEKTEATNAKQALDKAFSVNSLVMAGDQ